MGSLVRGTVAECLAGMVWRYPAFGVVHLWQLQPVAQDPFSATPVLPGNMLPNVIALQGMKFSVCQDPGRHYFHARFRLGKRQFRIRLCSTTRAEALVEATTRVAEAEQHADRWLAKPTRAQTRWSAHGWIAPWHGVVGVYAVASGCGRFFKIGRANDIGKRFADMQCDNALTLKPLGLLSPNPRDEAKFHRLFFGHRVDGGGREWFKLNRHTLRTLTKLVTGPMTDG